MPIIRIGSSVEQAGEAAGAFEQTRNPERQRVAQRVRDREQNLLQALKIQRDQEDISLRRDMNQKRLDLQERSTKVREDAEARYRAQASGGAFSGSSATRMARQMKEWDPESFAGVREHFDTITGGKYLDQELTPELIDSIPEKAEFLAALGPAYKQARIQHDSVYAKEQTESLIENVERSMPQWTFESKEGRKWNADLQNVLSKLDDETRTQQNVSEIIGKFRRAATDAFEVQQQRGFFRKQADEFMASKDWAAFKAEQLGDDYTKTKGDAFKDALEELDDSDEPAKVWRRMERLMDNALAQQYVDGMESGTIRALGQRSALEVRREQAAQQKIMQGDKWREDRDRTREEIDSGAMEPGSAPWVDGEPILDAPPEVPQEVKGLFLTPQQKQDQELRTQLERWGVDMRDPKKIKEALVKMKENKETRKKANLNTLVSVPGTGLF